MNNDVKDERKKIERKLTSGLLCLNGDVEDERKKTDRKLTLHQQPFSPMALAPMALFSNGNP